MQSTQTSDIRPSPCPSNSIVHQPETTPLSISSLPTPQICVICLYRVTEKAICLPCNHDQYDFPCLGTWLQQHQTCPLCKANVVAVKTEGCDGKSAAPTIFHLPDNELPQRTTAQISRRRQRNASTAHILHAGAVKDNTAALTFRRDVYRRGLYSSYVGANRYSGYRNVTPSLIASSPRLVAKAKMFVRRELRVFEFLDPMAREGGFGTADRRATNREFLLEYIVAMIQVVDLKGASGQAEELLGEYLGKGAARLFCHELESWLRFPGERLEVWDREVQYGEGVEAESERQDRYSLGSVINGIREERDGG